MGPATSTVPRAPKILLTEATNQAAALALTRQEAVSEQQLHEAAHHMLTLVVHKG